MGVAEVVQSNDAAPGSSGDALKGLGDGVRMD